MKIDLAMKIGLSIVLLAVWTEVCEADPSKDEGKDTFATKKEVEEAKKEVEEQKAELAKLRQELREEFRKELKEEVAKEKVANSKLRRADADILKLEMEMREVDKEEEKQNAALRKEIAAEQKQHAALRKRQNDVISETKKLIRAEINSEATKSVMRAEINSEATKSIIRAEIDAHKNCQSGLQNVWQPEGTGDKTFTVNFSPAFSRTPTAIASFDYVRGYNRKATKATQYYFGISVKNVSPTKMNLYNYGRNIYAQQVYWLACQ